MSNISNERLELANYIDTRYNIPASFGGGDNVKLIILGQDPTIKDECKRGEIKVVLNLDKKNGQLRRYCEDICENLNLSLDENVYATNYFKNFFIKPPTTIGNGKILQEFAAYWHSFLLKEISQFPGVPVLSLGQPLLSILVKKGSKKVRHYWGYNKNWKNGQIGTFSYLKPEDNILNRVILPFPHQPSSGKEFYQNQKKAYFSFINSTVLFHKI